MLQEKLEETEYHLSLTRIALDNSEEDRANLQIRIDDLAGEKASAEDRQRVAEAERDSAVYVANVASTAASDARQCLSDISVALDAIVSYASASYINLLVDVAVASCGQADASYAQFISAVS
ncbi:MAG TPA: hypothetical protein VNM91_09950 [Dehalococcoidia bacterium]|nr:hypothetical protein [Dehalococcoidia bacterium]